MGLYFDLTRKLFSKTLIICNLFQCEQKHRQIKEKNKLFGIPHKTIEEV